ncbi:alkaline phytoceramidase, partial [Wilcoxina mikolae CBS 423.85]
MVTMNWAYPKEGGISAWGPRTSTMNFCEIDYYMTPYIAEFINTISNLLYIYLAGHGMMHSAAEDPVVMWSYGLLGVVGMGSFMFHASLKYSTQMVDELSMLYATATVVYALYDIDLRGRSLWLGGVLSSAMLTMTFAHHYRGESSLHRLCFGVMIVLVWYKCLSLMKRVTDGRVKGEMTKLWRFGAFFFFSGYMMWLVDMFRCDDLRRMRATTGMPAGFVLELHGWWHILTALGVYDYMVFVEYLRL